MKKIMTLIAVLLVSAFALTATGCGDEANIASKNISKAADNFEVLRRTSFINAISDTKYLDIEGFCNIDDEGNQLEVTCKRGEDAFSKDFYRLCDNCTYVVEQLEDIDVSTFHYRRTFTPQSLIPDIDFRGSTEDTPIAPENSQP